MLITEQILLQMSNFSKKNRRSEVTSSVSYVFLLCWRVFALSNYKVEVLDVNWCFFVEVIESPTRLEPQGFDSCLCEEHENLKLSYIYRNYIASKTISRIERIHELIDLERAKAQVYTEQLIEQRLEARSQNLSHGTTN
jgi:hypothetical protein